MKFSASQKLANLANTNTEILGFLDTCTESSAYQFPYDGIGGDWFFSLSDGDKILFYGVATLGLGASRLMPFLKVLSFNRGPVARSIGAMEKGMEHVKFWAKERNVVSVSIRPDYANEAAKELVDRFLSKGWQQTKNNKRFTLRISINDTKEHMMQCLSKSCRYEIKRAQRKGVRVFPASTSQHVGQFLECFQAMCKRKNISDTAKMLIECLWHDTKNENDRLSILLAELRGQILGGTVVFRVGLRSEYLFGAIDTDKIPTEEKVSPGYLLQWESMLWAKNAGCAIHDFGGYDPTAKYGPAKMKRSFFKSPEAVQLAPELQYDIRPVVSKSIFLIRDLFRVTV